MEKTAQKGKAPKNDKENDLFDPVLENEEQSNQETVKNFENFFDEVKIEQIDYEWMNNEAQCERIENKTNKDLHSLQEKAKAKKKKEDDTIRSSKDYFGWKKYVEGRDLYILGEYKKAKQLFKESAELGHQRSMHYLGVLYEKGYGCKKSLKKASYWITLAIQNGSETAKDTLNNIIHEKKEKQGNCYIF